VAVPGLEDGHVGDTEVVRTVRHLVPEHLSAKPDGPDPIGRCARAAHRTSDAPSYQQQARETFRKINADEIATIDAEIGAAAFFTEIDREVSPTEPDFGALLRVASSHGLTVPLPAN
jgi:hypothetical protein